MMSKDDAFFSGDVVLSIFEVDGGDANVFLKFENFLA